VLSRGIKLVGALASPLFVLGGCVISPGSALAPEQSQVEFFDVIEQTQQLVGGSWETSDDPSARSCVIPFATEGERWSALRISADPADPRDALAAVTASWSELGYATLRTDIGPVGQVQGESEFGQVLVFRVSEAAMTLQGESECLPAPE